ncbi:sensor diguanylate cyclase/phosphodiesterase, GAF domain-containing [Desulfuromonas soudanensis]|uniref:Sensor diguanylate cyclase/phosphodiesterase, GAF domain-containing n=1 Tax=Desulfuromonas soudanensis TaxID=1603606 RepID=A0A0M5IU85_9BACT|nr:EAL domain-containing protein [Desulfuromonas soudanensis]ALC17256.1 sensor diguanylate cyclase/phosphodiesterase, GAF domain-containing [Desulfuromonas soudanensis]
MSETTPQKARRPLDLRRYTLALLIAWTLCIGASLAWNLVQNHRTILGIARNSARNAFDKDLLYRRWGALYGPVYLPVSPQVPPNPYLDVPEREVTTTSGRTLTMVNPAYMTRMVYDLAEKSHGIRSHLTSLNPLRPQNAPDPWEIEALRRFAEGEKEISSVVSTEGSEYLRFMRPFWVEEACLKCHSRQGYKIGDIRGGISISIPLAPLWSANHGTIVAYVLGHGLLWFLGLGGIALGVGSLRGQIRRREAAEDSLLEKETHLAFLANHDTLTGLPNRHLLHDRLDQAIARAQRSQRRIAILLIELDRFKTINDSLGHSVGDRVLCEITGRLLGTVRKSDTFARLGGDEFLLLLDDVGQVASIVTMAQRLLLDIDQPIRIDSFRVQVTASLGICLFPDDALDTEGLLKCAEVAMYRAKEMGRNNYQFYTPDMNARAHEFLEMENDLRRALDEDQFVLHYQPQVDMITGQLMGVEALLRWQHPQKGMIPPGDFIPLAEQTGLIIPIGDWVLRTACAQNRAWQDAGHPPVTMAVNISMRQFLQTDLVTEITRTLETTGLAPQFLEIEITESMLMSDFDNSLATLQALSRMGVRIAIDDFGSGFSSLSHLRLFPLHRLKIDRSFVRDLGDAPQSRAIAGSIVSLAWNLGLEPIAEGVEIEEQRDILCELGCRQAQGFLFARPLAAADFIEFLR